MADRQPPRPEGSTSVGICAGCHADEPTAPRRGPRCPVGTRCSLHRSTHGVVGDWHALDARRPGAAQGEARTRISLAGGRTPRLVIVVWRPSRRASRSHRSWGSRADHVDREPVTDHPNGWSAGSGRLPGTVRARSPVASIPAHLAVLHDHEMAVEEAEGDVVSMRAACGARRIPPGGLQLRLGEARSDECRCLA